MWAEVGFLSLKPLASWIEDLNNRIKFLNEWILHGTPKVFWISGSYLNSFNNFFILFIKQNKQLFFIFFNNFRIFLSLSIFHWYITKLCKKANTSY